MNLQTIISELEHNQGVFKDLLSNLPKDQILFRYAPEKWCLLEIVCHLYDEEREDFRARVKHVLETPGQPMPSIKPQEWVKERRYIEQDYEAVLEKFLEEREQSLQWLRSLKNPDWDSTYVHPEMGPLKAWLFFVNWAAHDYLHIRQITRTKYELLKQNSGTRLDYAGEW